MVSHIINVRGISGDVSGVYREMVAESESAGGHRVHTSGLKYTLARMYGLPVDHRTPKQPLRAMREETAAELQRLGWIDSISGKNNGVYVLLR